MTKANKENTLIIMAAEGGFPFNGFVAEGYHTVSAYKPTNLLKRLMREICFRIPLLPKKIWYNPEIKNYKPEYVYIRDAIITKKYLLWLQYLFPKAQMNFCYENMVLHARHLMPDEIPEGIRVWTYDPSDSRKYNIRLKKVTPYFHCYLKERKEKKYDLLFVGRDKGRGDWLKKLESFLKKNGLRTKFLITADGKYSKKKSYYEKPVSYEQVTDWVAESKALLNIAMQGQEGVTLRDIESYFNQIKLVSTNKNIRGTEIYNEKNTFFLSDNNWIELVQFLKQDYILTQPATWNGHRIEDAIEEITT